MAAGMKLFVQDFEVISLFWNHSFGVNKISICLTPFSNLFLLISIFFVPKALKNPKNQLKS